MLDSRTAPTGRRSVQTGGVCDIRRSGAGEARRYYDGGRADLDDLRCHACGERG
jgi:hypothetical protein